MNIYVKNKRDSRVFPGIEIYVGRSHYKYHFGNPFSSKPSQIAEVPVKDKETAIRCFDNWLEGTEHQTLQQERRRWILDQIGFIAAKDTDVTLVCWCKPENCHGDIIKRRIEQLRKKE